MPLTVIYVYREFILPVAICYGIFQVDEKPLNQVMAISQSLQITVLFSCIKC